MPGGCATEPPGGKGLAPPAGAGAVEGCASAKPAPAKSARTEPRNSFFTAELLFAASRTGNRARRITGKFAQNSIFVQIGISGIRLQEKMIGKERRLCKMRVDLQQMFPFS
jgi:hypothetical protein